MQPTRRARRHGRDERGRKERRAESVAEEADQKCSCRGAPEILTATRGDQADRGQRGGDGAESARESRHRNRRGSRGIVTAAPGLDRTREEKDRQRQKCEPEEVRRIVPKVD